METRKIEVNISDILNFAELQSPEANNYLDLRSGEVIIISDYDVDNEKLLDTMEEHPDRYELIPPLTSSESYEWMEGFILTVKDDKLNRKLVEAVRKPQPFRRFREVIAGNLDEEMRWFDYRDRSLKKKIRDWLLLLGVETKEEPVDEDRLLRQTEYKKQAIAKAVNKFTKLAGSLDGVVEIALHSPSAEKKAVKYLDFLVFMENMDCMGKLAECYRKATADYLNISAMLFTGKKEFLGHVCVRKDCPGGSIDCKTPGCGKIKHVRKYLDFEFNPSKWLKYEPEILWLAPKHQFSISGQWHRQMSL